METDKAVEAFCKVRDGIDQTKHPQAYRRAFKMPLRFYKEHTTEEAIKILIEQEK